MFKRKVDQNVLGRGRSHYSCELDNAIYEGDALHYKKDGIGMLIHDDGTVYFGGFSQDNLHGEGIIFFSQGGMLYAMFEKGKPNGFFVSVLRGTYACGYLSQSKLNGRNYVFCPLKKSWTFSEFQNGQKIRDISEEPSNQETTQSSFLLRDAYLSEKFRNFLELRIDSIFKKNVNSSFSLLECKENPLLKCVGFIDTSTQQLNGIGCVISKSSVQMSGRYSNGSLQGLGRVTHPNGDIYDGFFRNDMLEGQGIYYTKKTNSFVYADFKNNECRNILYQGYDYPAQVSRKMKKKIHQRSIYYMNSKADFLTIGISLPALFKSVTEPSSINRVHQSKSFDQKQISAAKLGLDDIILTPSDFEQIELKNGVKIPLEQKMNNEFRRDPMPDFTQSSINISNMSPQPLIRTPPKGSGISGFESTTKSSFLQSSEKQRQSPSRRIFPENNSNSSFVERSPEMARQTRSGSSVRFSESILPPRIEESKDVNWQQFPSDIKRSINQTSFSPSPNQTPDLTRVASRSPLTKKYPPIFQKDSNKSSQARLSQPSSAMSRSRNSSSLSLNIPHEQNLNQPFLSKMKQLTDNYPIPSSPSPQKQINGDSHSPNHKMSTEPAPDPQQLLNYNNRQQINSQKYYSPEFNPSTFTLKDIMRTLNHPADQPIQQNNNLIPSQPPRIQRSSKQVDFGATSGLRISTKQS